MAEFGPTSEEMGLSPSEIGLDSHAQSAPEKSASATTTSLTPQEISQLPTEQERIDAMLSSPKLIERDFKDFALKPNAHLAQAIMKSGKESALALALWTLADFPAGSFQQKDFDTFLNKDFSQFSVGSAELSHLIDNISVFANAKLDHELVQKFIDSGHVRALMYGTLSQFEPNSFSLDNVDAIVRENPFHAQALQKNPQLVATQNDSELQSHLAADIFAAFFSQQYRQDAHTLQELTHFIELNETDFTQAVQKHSQDIVNLFSQKIIQDIDGIFSLDRIQQDLSPFAAAFHLSSEQYQQFFTQAQTSPEVQEKISALALATLTQLTTVDHDGYLEIERKPENFSYLQELINTFQLSDHLQRQADAIISQNLLKINLFWFVDGHYTENLNHLTSLFNLSVEQLSAFPSLEEKLRKETFPIITKYFSETGFDLERIKFFSDQFGFSPEIQQTLQQYLDQSLQKGPYDSSFNVKQILTMFADKLPPQPQALAEKLIQADLAVFVLEHPDFFADLSFEEALIKVFASGKANYEVGQIIKALPDRSLSKNAAEKIYAAGALFSLTRYQDKFQDFIIDDDFVRSALSNPNFFRPAPNFIENLEDLHPHSLSQDTLKELLRLSATDIVIAPVAIKTIMQHPDKFISLQLDNNFAELIMQTKNESYNQQLAANLGLFAPHSLDNLIAFDLIDKGQAGDVLKNATVFDNLEFNKDLADWIIGSESQGDLAALAHSLTQFPAHSLSATIANALADQGFFNDVFTHQETFSFSKDTQRLFDLMKTSTAAIQGYEAEVFQTLKNETLDNLTAENFQIIASYIQEIKNSPSSELRNFQAQIIHEILSAADNPNEQTEKFTQIKNVFEKNHLPVAFKIFKIFQILHSDGKLDAKIDDRNVYSANLKQAGIVERRRIILRDLFKSSLESNNRSLRHYLTMMIQAESLFDQLESRSTDTLDELNYWQSQQPDKFAHFIDTLNRLITLYNGDFLTGLEHADQQAPIALLDSAASPDAIFDVYLTLEERFGDNVKNVFGAFSRNFSPLGFASPQAALDGMDQHLLTTDQRNRQRAQQAQAGTSPFILAENDLIKGVIGGGRGQIQYLESIFQNGSNSKEYLGSAEATPTTEVIRGDATKLDTDVGFITADLITKARAALEKGSYTTSKGEERSIDQGNFFDALQTSTIANGYGSLKFVLKNEPGRFNLTDRNLPEQAYDPTKLEVFHAQEAFGNPEHGGIRTGFGLSEVDFLILGDDWGAQYRQIVFFEIAKNGFYVPITDERGQLIFTPEDYDHYRQTFNGLARYGSEAFQVSDQLTATPESAPLIQEIKQQESLTVADREAVYQHIITTLHQHGIHMKEALNGDLSTGAELIDTGSTGRFTNIPDGKSDFDLMLRLDPAVTNNPELKSQLARDILTSLNPNSDFPEDVSNEERSKYNVITSDGDLRKIRARVEVAGQTRNVEVDVTFVVKTGAIEFTSDQAVSTRLEQLKSQNETQYYQVLAEIVRAKQLLKEGHVYKAHRSDASQGGLGGIGVENWLLQNGGSLRQAAETFVQAAEQAAAQATDPSEEFQAFKKLYPIFDPGQNFVAARKGTYVYDNFIDVNMSADGYQKMLAVCRQILQS